MADIFEKIVKQLNSYSDKTVEKTSSFIKKTMHFSKTYTEKGKTQIEIEKCKWDLRKLYIDLASYIADINQEDNTTDFSHDKNFFMYIDKIQKQRSYINYLQSNNMKSSINKANS